MGLKDYDFNLPRELVAAYPAPKRSEARLLVLDRVTGDLEHRIFKDVIQYFRKGDLLVLNNTKVIPARLFGKRTTGGKVEALLLKQGPEDSWEMLVKPSGRIKKGSRIIFGENGIRLEGEVLDEPSGENGIRRIRFLNVEAPLIAPLLSRIGRIPLPPYMNRAEEPLDREMYQTVFAEKEGAVASPTAGLHFDQELLNELSAKGVEIAFVTLHVSYGTFQPVQAEDLTKHEMYEEEFEITAEAARQISRARHEGRRIVACGTTVVRVLETAGAESLRPVRGRTRLFIYPPYEFQVVNAMITNFHTPRSTLLMLVSAFAGREKIFQAYEEALCRRYRFYSYGDAMLIL